MGCAFCGEPLSGEIYVHAACTAEFDRRKAARRCIGCGVRDSAYRGWCGMCVNQVYVGYPGGT